MLVAIEEISGKIVELAKLKWTHEIKLRIDGEKTPNSRISAVKYQTTCTHEDGNYFIFF